MNCIIIEDNEISREVIENYVEKTGFLKLLRSFPEPISALAFLSENPVDLILLDIELPEMNGIEFIRTIKDRHHAHIILITSHKEFALDAFEHSVVDYLVKPITYGRFYKAVEKIRSSRSKSDRADNEKEDIFIRKGTGAVRIQKSDILWVEALGDYVTVNTHKGKFVIHTTMKSIEDKLPSKDYVRVHRSYIVRLDKIDRIEGQAIVCNEKHIPIGKSYRENIFKRLEIL